MANVNPYRYAGYMYDEETGLYYLMARYYDAGIGRFISRDTFARFNDDPASLNQYTYTHNNPVMYVDPDGHFLQAAAIGGVVGGISFLAEKFFVDKNPTWNKNEYIKLGTAVLTGAAGGAYGSGITASKAAQVGFAFYSSIKGRIISFAWEEHLTKKQVVEGLKREILFSVGNGVVKTLTKSGGVIIRSISNFLK